MNATACILCSRNCGLLVDPTDGHLRKIRGDPAHPISQGYLCEKAGRLDHYQHNAERLTHPLRRLPDGSYARATWDEAIADIAARLTRIRAAHGGHAYAYYGGGGQANQLTGAYGLSLMAAMRSTYFYNSLAQEKTGDFWLNGRLFGSQTCHTTEDVAQADVALFIGTNPWQAHGVRNAREVVRSLGRDPARKVIVLDPRRTETADLADIHLQLRPGTDAYLLSAILAIQHQEGWFDLDFIRRHTTGYDAVARSLARVPVAEFVRRADVPLDQVREVARLLGTARRAVVRADLGLQQTLNSTLNSYLEKLLFLLSGHFGKPGCNNLHSTFYPLIIHAPEHPALNRRTRVAGMPSIAGYYPHNLLPAEIDNDRPDRVRAVVVDCANPLLSGADSQAYEAAFARLELLVVLDVALTETARRAHWVLPVASQFEKWELSGFNLEFPDNFFQLRAPVLPPPGEALPEPEIYRRLLVAMGDLPARFPLLERIAVLDRRAPALGLYLLALGLTLVLRPWLIPVFVLVLARTMGLTLPEGAWATAPTWLLSHAYAWRYRAAVRRAGHRGWGLGLGESLAAAIAQQRSGVVISRHRHADTWSFLWTWRRRVRLAVPEMLAALDGLGELPAVDPAYPLLLVAGERRTSNANGILRDPAWRRTDGQGAMHLHPSDAARLGLRDGDHALCRSARGQIVVQVRTSDRLRPGVVTLPNGYGQRYAGGAPVGPALNQLTWSAHRDPIAGTPYHKVVPVAVERYSEPASAP